MPRIRSVILSCVQAMSPDGEAIVTGAGDETLRFWNVFSKMRSTKVLILHTSPFVTFPPVHRVICCDIMSVMVVALPPISVSLFYLGISLGAEPLHQDPVV